MSHQSQSRRNANPGASGGGVNDRPSVPTIERRSNSFRLDDDDDNGNDALIMARARQHVGSSVGNRAAAGAGGSLSYGGETDEFGFPITQQQQHGPPAAGPRAHAPTVTQKVTDLESVSRPSRLMKQRSQYQHQHQHQHHNASTVQRQHSQGSDPTMQRQHSLGSDSQQQYPQQHQRVQSQQQHNGIPRNNSANMQQRPPRSASYSLRTNNSFIRQSSHQSSTSSKTSQRSKARLPRIKISRPDPQRYNQYTFQHPANAMRLSIRTVDLSSRVAFDARIPPSASSASLRRLVGEMDRVRGSRIVGGSVVSGGSGMKQSDNPCRISPSPNHVALLEFMHGMPSSGGGQDGAGRRSRVVRQLQWNVACSPDADPWFDGSYEEDEGDGDCVNALQRGLKNASLLDGAKKQQKRSMRQQKQPSQKRRRPKSSHGDGRYVPIDPLSATRSALPDHSPILTNVKRRLPVRADVGFANPRPEEVAMKMGEVKKEAEWEEASPRIVLLASGFSLFERRDGRNSNDSNASDENDDGMDELHPSCQADVELWAGGSIPGVPFAGRDLVEAYKLNAKKNDNMQEEEILSQQSIDVERCKNPRSYSVFAPPVDATFSYSNIWRPRPFMDRPPGHLYLLACPLDVRFDAGDVEPLFCTMALYSLPRTAAEPNVDANSQHRRSSFSGKVSEDFFFPAGDWNDIEGVERDNFDDDDDDQPQQSWRRRKRRAIMSYDPLELSPEDLHLVIQVFRVVQPYEGDAPNNLAGKPKKSIGSKIKRGLSKGMVKDRERQSQSPSLPIEDTLNHLASLDEVGARYLTPVCFCVTPAFTRDETQKQESASFFSFPDVSESEEDFVKRVAFIATSAPPPKTKSERIGGYADVFTSYLGRDFTRALLDEPPQLYNALDDVAPLGPQLLADVMGDCAISFDDPTASEGTKKQRSQLRRLPPSRESGYASSFDLKEVLYLPPRSLPRKYEDDAALCSSTILNLLYVYPRLIRFNNDSQKGVGGYLSIRVRVVEQELPPDQQSFDSADPTFHGLHAVYNPSSPAGPPLIESFFSKLANVPVDDARDGKSRSGRKDIPLKDEVKLRLPDILDRRHFLQFSLFSVRGDAFVELLGETTIPFIISSKESISGGRVTTIIPNGLHRIQLSEGVQVHVETRLASSFHVSDPSVATLLRDYPLFASAGNRLSAGGSVNGDLDSASSASDIIVHASSGFPFLDILTMASGQAVKRHFLALIASNLIAFLNQSCPSFYFESLLDAPGNGGSTWHRLVAWDKTDSLLAILRSLFEIIDKARILYQERDCSMLSVQFHRLIKSFLDAFDEQFYSHRESDSEAHQRSEDRDSFSERKGIESIDSSRALDDDIFYDDVPSSLNVAMDDQKRAPKYKITSPKSDISTRSFTRRAFIATRSERLQAEADLNNDDDAYGREYLDDDETVATLGTMASRMDASVFPVILETKSFATVGNYDDIVQSKSSTFAIQEETASSWNCGSGIGNDQTPKRAPSQPKASTPFSFASRRAEYMANRVNTMAQLVMAPCIAPSMDGIVSGPSGSPRRQIQVTGQPTRYGTGNQSPYEPSSDAEEEGVTKSAQPCFRGNQSCLKIPPITFKPMSEPNGSTTMNGEPPPKLKAPYLYETIIAIWMQSWTALAASMKSDVQIRGSSKNVPTWPYELILGSHSPTSDAVVAFAFIQNMSFFLPLCLKSLGLRCANKSTAKLIVAMTFLDDNHMQILVPLVETVALGLMRQATSGSSGNANSDQMITKSLANSVYIVDFLIGLFTVLHPSQAAILLFAYFNIFEECEAVDAGNKSHFRRCKCARQLRLNAVERLAAVPTFARLNFPIKFTGSYPRKKAAPSSWTKQGDDCTDYDPFKQEWGKVERSPQPFWLSDLLMNQCLSICSASCKMIIIEATKQAKARAKTDTAVLPRSDLLRVESIAFHSILCAYELLIKRQAMDSRFQSVSSSTRIAAACTKAVLQHSIEAVSLLARMDPNQKVRMIWLLCLLYILQEGPDALIRAELLRLCSPKDNRITSLIHLLKLASTSCQYFIPGEGSLPVIGGLSKEMTQEAFNCLSATAILLVDECFDVIARDESRLVHFGESLLDLLLLLLSTPQSSVTLLRTLGGSAHALDKFGASVFLKAVGNQLQHWARIVLTMMNSMELSVRSMAVDFMVSLLGGIYQESGSIDSISLCILTVLPEVVAREIAMCEVSGLIESMESAESALWPLRRALADVEETNPMDDDRVDPLLLPSLTTLCRTGQAVVDGVLVEMRLKCSAKLDLNAIAKARRTPPSAGLPQLGSISPDAIFDADEESVLEAATFFSNETSLLQKLRWLFTLRDLHVAKNQWCEAVEVMFLCAKSLIKSLEYLLSLWWPSKFDLWSDSQCSPWLSLVGSPDARFARGNMVVVEFSSAFLEPTVLVHPQGQRMNARHLSVESVCLTLNVLIDQFGIACAEEEGMEDIACSNLEELLSMVTSAISSEDKPYHSNARAALRRVRATICSNLAKLTEHEAGEGPQMYNGQGKGGGPQIYVRIILHGKKPTRFQESTAIPTFLEWDMPSICRVPKPALVEAARMKQQHPSLSWEDCICQTFTRPFLNALSNDDVQSSIVLRTRGSQDTVTDASKTYVSAMVVQKKSPAKSRKFFVRHGHDGITEYSVAHAFPHALSRQRSLITTEIKRAGRH